MASYMEDLTSKWVGWSRRRYAVEDEVIALVRKTDDCFDGDEERRVHHLRRLQTDFYRVAIADKLLEDERFSSYPPATRLELADEILGKRGNASGTRTPGSETRSAQEERYYGTVRVRWCYLLKKARVRAADPRGGDTSHHRMR